MKCNCYTNKKPRWMAWFWFEYEHKAATYINVSTKSHYTDLLLLIATVKVFNPCFGHLFSLNVSCKM